MTNRPFVVQSVHMSARGEIAAVFETQAVDGPPFSSGVINGHLGPGTSCGDTLGLMGCVKPRGTQPGRGTREVLLRQLIHDPMSEDHLAELQADVAHYKKHNSGAILAQPGECAGCHYNKSGMVGCPRQEEFTKLRYEMLICRFP